MFQLYTKLLSVNGKYTWNKIIQEQITSDPYTDLQGCTMKGHRGLLRKSFDNCMMFHLLIVFASNTAEQDQYYITNVLKTPQHISICQFVQHVEQLDSYMSQLTCWYYSPSAKMTTIPMSVTFAKANLASHILRMCPHMWQDQFTLNKKGKTPVDMYLLLMSHKAIERLCTLERSNSQHHEKASHKGDKGNKRPGIEVTVQVPQKVITKNIAACARSMGAHTPSTIPRIVVGMRKTEWRNPASG
jgi:hypothetical protein